MNCLMILSLVIVAVYCHEAQESLDKLFKVKRETSKNQIILEDNLSNIHIRRRRSAAKSYIYFENRSERKAQLWYRETSKKPSKWVKFSKKIKPGSGISIDTYVDDEWSALDVRGNTLLINDKIRFHPEANTKSNRALCVIKRPGQNETSRKAAIEVFIETLIVMDKSARDRFSTDDEAKKYAEILLSLASDAYRHKSLSKTGLNIYLVPSRVVILKYEIKFDPKKEWRNYNTACSRMNKIADQHSQKYDHKLFLTRNAFGAGGYALKNGMCSQSSSCSMVYDYGFHAAYMIAHEVGHSLGLSHVEFVQYSRLIMSPAVDSLLNDHRWSEKSQQTLLTNVRKYRKRCLGNKPVSEVERYVYPGVHFSFQRQCDLEFNDTFTAWKPSRWELRYRPQDRCAELKCRELEKVNVIRATSAPALDGTECGKDMWCVSGKCQEKPQEYKVKSIMIK